ncbi:NAD(P)/FAD-dependent oxidoreductase [Silvimonas soli]|uniref:NAD(P)/FAD-dependent oxidoreductase n=1 Tax=Silvimonas soli TaxID=2980100 RepID=UPI0024B3BA28|nr:FAD-binding oxidoreductase [Silvimonas soli]
MDQREAAMVQNSWYEASVTREPDDPALQGNIDADVCIIGGGFTGLSTAIALRQRGLSVVVLEAERVGWGASGRNGGQVLVGFAKDEPVINQLGPADARRAWDISVEGVKLLHRRVEQYDIDCDLVRGYLHVATSPRKAQALDAWVEQLRGEFGYEAIDSIAPAAVPKWIASPRYVGAANDRLSGHIHPLKYCLGLARVARTAGARIYAHSKVIKVERGPQPVVRTSQGQVRCKFVVAAGNAWLGDLLPKVTARIMPVRSFIIATVPIAPELANSLIHNRCAVCDTNFMIDYFRLSADNRMLFGGRISNGKADPMALIPQMRERLAAVFPQLAQTRVEYAWGGFVDVSMNRAPDFGRADANFYYLQGFSGHGVALTGIAGEMVADAIAGQAERFDLFARLKHHAYPGGPAMHGALLRLGVLYHQMKELV